MILGRTRWLSGAGFAGLVLVGLTAIACQDPTQIIVSVATDMNIDQELDGVTITVDQLELGTQPVRLEWSFSNQEDLPATLAVNAIGQGATP